ncbi:hypothetical protein SAMN06265348_107110 [Pedobacter westerhofensis]|uniref:Right handed beta helix region n=1 Tax=Pedobacter westerhofensis TaxID=425512 RepID=A0A521E6H7_9SPHI|nr:hypothetical protein [Pedobacter westerhofensis]SMO79507.1 hypothetical protein SAMN06265348_107110 [Pedobacter westerhofensis]
MVKNQAILAVLIASISLMSCKKDGFRKRPTNETTTTTPVVTEPVVAAPASTYAVPSDATIFDLGTGSGYLVIDGTTLNIPANSFIRIKAGSYKGITIKNILATTAKPVYIKNVGAVTISESMTIQNVSNVVVDGDNTAGITYGFAFNNISYRAITLSTQMTGLVLKSMSFKNVDDYVISADNNLGTARAYDGTAATRTDGFKILNCLFDNVGTIALGGALSTETNEDTGLFKDVEIAYNTFQNSQEVGTVCSFTNVQDYNIHHNVVNNINTSNDNHNGVFFMQGNGKFHENKLTNYQGNAIRMWLYSRGSTPATSEIYDNTCYNTRKYSGFELQGFTRNMWSGKSTYSNAKVYNNTVGHMNTNKDWEGQLLDLYNINGGSIEYYNNLGYDLNTLKGSVTNMINNMSDTKITVESNNKYTALQQNAVTDLVNFVTKFVGIGAVIN